MTQHSGKGTPRVLKGSSRQCSGAINDMADFVLLALALTPWRAGQLGEALSGLVGCHRSVVDLTANRPLKHGRVDEGGFGMRVTRRVTARAVFDQHAGTFGSSCW
jgi:hypothetical protein